MSKRRVWIHPNDPDLPFRSQKENRPRSRPASAPPPPPPTPEQQREREEAVLQTKRRQRLEEIEHQIEVVKRLTDVSGWKKKIRENDRDDPPLEAEFVDPERQAMLDARLREHEAEAQFGRRVVSKAKAEVMKIYNNHHILAGEKYRRMQKTLDAYGVDASILPPALQEFMAEQDAAHAWDGEGGNSHAAN